MNKEKSKMKFFIRFYFVLIGMLLYSTSEFASVNVQNIRVGNQSDGARVVFDISQSIN